MALNRRIVTNAVQLQQALNDAATQPISIIQIDEDLIQLTAPLLIPGDLFAPGKHLIIEGNGCTIQPTVANAVGVPYLMHTDIPPNQAIATQIVQNRFTIKDITFNGRLSNLTCLELIATSHSSVINCRFLNAPTGLRVRYAPHTRVINCFARAITGIGIDINQATFGAFNPSKQFPSPFSRIENFEMENESSTFASIQVIASGNCIISQFTSTTKNPLHHIYYDSNFFNEATGIMIDNVSFNRATRSAIKLLMNGGYAKISGVINNVNQVLIDAESQVTTPGKTYPRVYLEHYPDITSGTQFKTGGGCGASNVIWSFFDVDEGRDIFIPTRWVDSNVPTHRYSEYFDNNKEIVTNSMKVNNNIISA